jgi:RimJ/RimL family protein N-acetyltransferase
VTTTVTRLGQSDWRVFAVMRLRALTEILGERDPQYQLEVTFTAARWRRRLRDHAQFALLVDGHPVGLIAAQRQTRQSVYLYSLWLDPVARGQGLARVLVTAAVDWARDQRATTVTLRVASGNVAARAVYLSVGFADVAAAENTEATDEIVMKLSVS